MITAADLKTMGFAQQPDGSYTHTKFLCNKSKNEQPQDPTPRLRDTKHERVHTKTLVNNPPAKTKSTGRTAERVTVRITRHSTRLLDADNLAGGCKFLIDAMRHEKLILDDDPETIELLFSQRKCKRGQEHTEIEILTGSPI